MEWKVPMVVPSICRPRRTATRSRSSRAAFLVKVTPRNLMGADALLLDQPGDAVGDDAGLAATGAGEDEEGAGGVGGGLTLGGVEAVEEGGRGVEGHGVSVSHWCSSGGFAPAGSFGGAPAWWRQRTSRWVGYQRLSGLATDRVAETVVLTEVALCAPPARACHASVFLLNSALIAIPLRIRFAYDSKI